MTSCVRVSVLLALVALSGCTCQRAENVAAKERLTKPQPKELSSTKATEPIDVDALTDADKMKRVVHMDGSEIAARLGSFVYTSSGELAFGREGDSAAPLKSAEKTKVVQGELGDFAIDVVTGDGSEQKLAYVNEIFYLKNGNGQWRVSRDPAGERNVYRSDAMAVWASFYDLVAHALVVERIGATKHGGRGGIAFSLKLPDQGKEAKEAGQAVTDSAPPSQVIPGVDGGPDTVVEAEENEDTRRERIAKRVSLWAKRAKPAGGSGKIIVDEATGVPLMVEFSGALVVGDGKEPARLTVKLTSSMQDVGKAQKISAPQDAIDEIVRRKMPATPRATFEEAGIVAPIPKEDVPGAPTPKAKPAAAPEPPEDE